MVSTLTWVLAGVVAYTVVAMALRTQGLLPDSVRISGPITTLHTKRGRDLLDWLAAPRRFWRAWGNLGIGIALVVMVGSFVLVILAGLQTATRPELNPVQNPQNALIIPGVNEFLPLSVAPEIVFGLVIGLVVHEGGHGLLCRVEDIDVDSMGLAFLTVVPIGAFVEPDEESRLRADRGAQTRMFAAGVTNNFAISIVAFLLLFGPVAGSIAVVGGVPVGSAAGGSSAAEAGIERGDVITAVEGTSVDNGSEIDRVLAATSDRTVTVRLRSGDEVRVERRLIVTRTVPGFVETFDRDDGELPRILAVNGTEVGTERAFHRAVADRPVVRLRTDEGNVTLPAGAFVARVNPDGPLAQEGAPTDGTPLVITSVGGERTPNASALAAVLDEYRPDESATVVAYVDGERRTYEVAFAAADDGDARLGVVLRSGTSGITVDDLGIQPYPAERFLFAIGGGRGLFGGLTGGTVFAQIYYVFILPIQSLSQSGAFNFAGFTGGVENFYRTTGPFAFLGGAVLATANVLFWTAWINFQIALFNCIPTFPLDGGHILRTSTESVVSRLPLGDKRTLTTAVTSAVTLAMLASLVLLFLGPMLLT